MPRLVILDIMMPRLDGFATCRRIKELKDVPIIMLSARQEEHDKLFGFDEDKVRELILLRPTEANIDEYGKFQELMDTLDEDKAQIYFESRDNKKYPKPMIRVKADNLARKFIILGGIEI